MIWANFLHFYQPPTQKEYWVRRITDECYRKIVEHLKDNPEIKLTLNINAVLAEMWAKYGLNDVLLGVKELASMGQIELTGSAKYHPLLPKLPRKEVERQVLLNEAGLFRYFGVIGPVLKKACEDKKLPEGLISEEEMAPLSDYSQKCQIRGFFPPEMAYSPELAKMVGELGYEWVLAEELSYSDELGRVDYRKLYSVEGAGIKVFFRDRIASFKVLSGQLSTPKLFLDEFKDRNRDGEYFLTAMDGETFGHHRPGLDKTLVELYRNPSVQSTQISTLCESEREVVVTPTKPSTWALMERDMRKGIPFARWEDSDNEIHAMQWELTALAIETVEKSSLAQKDYFGEAQTGWERARMLLDRSLHSDQYWWASAKPWWSLEMVERGAKELMEVVLSVPDASQAASERAKDLYMRIITTGFTWQREGRVDEMSRQNDEEILMNIDEELKDLSREQIEKMISIQQREMESLMANLEFERAIHPRNRIRELREYIQRKFL